MIWHAVNWVADHWVLVVALPYIAFNLFLAWSFIQFDSQGEDWLALGFPLLLVFAGVWIVVGYGIWSFARGSWDKILVALLVWFCTASIGVVALIAFMASTGVRPSPGTRIFLLALISGAAAGGAMAYVRGRRGKGL